MKKKVHSVGGYILYSLGAIPSALPYNMIQSFFVLFYTTQLGLTLERAGLILIIYAIWNAINDPIIGIWMDKKKTRWGRRIPYIVVGTIPLTIGFILLWIVPWESTTLIFIHGLIMLFLFDLGFTLAMTGWSALYTEMYEDAKERATVVAIKDLLAFLSSMIGIVLPPLIASALGWGYAGLILGAFIPITMLLSLLGSQERKEYQIDEPLGLFPALKATFRNLPFVIITLTYALIDYVFGLTMTVLPLYAKFILEMEESMIGFAAAGVAIGILGAIPFWRWIYAKKGPKFGLMLAILSFGATIWLLFLGQTFTQLLIISIFPGFGACGMLMTEPAVSTAIDYDEIHTGKRREASYNGILTLVARLSIAFTGFTLIVVKYFTGFDSSEILQSPEELNGLRSLLTIVPVIATGICVVIFAFFPINQTRFDVLQKTLKELHKARRDRLK